MLFEFPFLRVLRQKLLDICRRALLYNIDILYWGCTELPISYCLCIYVCLFLICVIVFDDVDDDNGWFCIIAVDDVDDDSGWHGCTSSTSNFIFSSRDFLVPRTTLARFNTPTNSLYSHHHHHSHHSCDFLVPRTTLARFNTSTHFHYITALRSNCVEMETSRKSQMSTSGKF